MYELEQDCSGSCLCKVKSTQGNGLSLGLEVCQVLVLTVHKKELEFSSRSFHKNGVVEEMAARSVSTE